MIGAVNGRGRLRFKLLPSQQVAEREAAMAAGITAHVRDVRELLEAEEESAEPIADYQRCHSDSPLCYRIGECAAKYYPK